MNLPAWLRRGIVLRRLAGLALAMLAVVGSGAAAWAHASLVAAAPADGAVLSAAPARFSLTFNEPVSPLVLNLVRPDGGKVPLERATLRGQTLEIAAPPDLSRGTHVLAWRVVSEDGHPVAGSVVFSIGAPGAAPPVAEAVDWPVRAGLWAGRLALYAGLFLGAGGVFAARWLSPSPPPRRLLLFVAAGLLGGAVALGFQGLDALGAPVGHIADAATWKAGYRTSFGRTALFAGIALAAASASFLLPRSPARMLALAGLLGVGAALAASGHAGAAPPQWLTRPAVFVHAAAIAVWTGALLPLALTLKAGGPDAAAALRRFSAAIPFVVAALVAAGAVLAVVQVGTPAALLSTAYGRVLLVKLALLAVLFGLAAVNRWRLTGPSERGEAAATRRLVRSIAAETAVVLLVFAAAACWRFTPPPRALAMAAAEPADVHIHTLDAMAEVVITPGRAGPVASRITIMTGDYGPLDAKEVTLVLASATAGIEPIRRPARKAGDGAWQVDDVTLPVPGTWQVRVDILVSDFKLVRLPAEIVIRP